METITGRIVDVFIHIKRLKIINALHFNLWGQRGRAVRTLDLESGGPVFQVSP